MHPGFLQSGMTNNLFLSVRFPSLSTCRSLPISQAPYGMMHRCIVKQYRKNPPKKVCYGLAGTYNYRYCHYRNSPQTTFFCYFFLANPPSIHDFYGVRQTKDREYKLTKVRNPVCFSYSLTMSLLLYSFQIS